MASNDSENELLLKIVVVGDSGVGKSNLLSRYIHNYFNEDITATLGVDLLSKRTRINGKQVQVQFWDTAGQERLRALANAYYRNANGVVVVFDITSKSSFANLPYWIQEVRKNSEEGVKVAMVGNKTDLLSQRQVSVEEARKFAEEKGFSYVEVSAKLNYENRVNECLDGLSKQIVDGLTIERQEALSHESKLRKDNLKSVQTLKAGETKARPRCCQYI